MSAVLISATFKKDARPNNGLEAIAEELIKDELSPRLVVAIVVPHAYTRQVGQPLVPTVRIAAIEVVDGQDAIDVQGMLDKQRAARHQQPVERTLFDRHADDEDDE